MNFFKYKDWDTGEEKTAWLMVGFVLFATITLSLLLFDITQELRSSRAQIRCRQNRMIPYRVHFTDEVICVPSVIRNDTLTVR